MRKLVNLVVVAACLMASTSPVLAAGPDSRNQDARQIVREAKTAQKYADQGNMAKACEGFGKAARNAERLETDMVLNTTRLNTLPATGQRFASEILADYETYYCNAAAQEAGGRTTGSTGKPAAI
ncbi:hypothetical protein PQU92_08730 [Asticcacaulis sp. BYS171W]|uniref:UrcA family protein n=1 Tax=Asticcacaulis aquaticus TaxID=2984212 RepID=A0ABT5HTJ8_9CAUL|nr:hypothetical protein [Asticcacaulis aquaticus]MDC7683359.1 hypothetical protein [Asticcacaulis aquaticus]